MYVESITLLTKEYNEYTVITPKVLDIVKRSGVQNGTVTVLTKHTTTGVTVNEALECLESDIENFLGRLIPEDYPYRKSNRTLESNAYWKSLPFSSDRW